MNPIIIFGNGEIAEIAHYYFTHDTSYKIKCFAVDSQYCEENKFCGLNVIPFDEIENTYSPNDYDMFIAVGYSKLNQIRTQKYLQAKAKGFELVSYISSKATILTELAMGDNCFILEDNTIQPFVKIGNNVTLWSGNHIGHHVSIADNNFISSHVVISGGVQVQENCFIGVNATIRDHITIAENCVIGAGSLILHNTQANGVYTMPEAQLSKVPSHKLRGI